MHVFFFLQDGQGVLETSSPCQVIHHYSVVHHGELFFLSPAT